jgi:hypothetical protein
MNTLDDAIRFGGLVMAHAAWIVSDIEEGSLLCPFALLQTGDERHVVAFESESQAESVERGKASFDEQRGIVDFWGFAREGLLSNLGSDEAKVDVLTVSSWKRGLDEPVVLRQCFVPNTQGSFRLLGPLEIRFTVESPPSRPKRRSGRLRFKESSSTHTANCGQCGPVLSCNAPFQFTKLLQNGI